MQKTTFVIKDMDCSEEVAVLKKVLLPFVGQESRLEFDLLGRKLHVDLSGLLVNAENVAEAINATGMKAELFVDALPSCACCGGTCPARGSLWERRGRELLCVVSGLLWAGGLAIMMTEHGSILAAFKASGAAPVAAKLLWILAALGGVWHVLPKAIRSLRALRPDMNLLMVLDRGRQPLRPTRPVVARLRLS